MDEIEETVGSLLDQAGIDRSTISLPAPSSTIETISHSDFDEAGPAEI